MEVIADAADLIRTENLTMSFPLWLRDTPEHTAEAQLKLKLGALKKEYKGLVKAAGRPGQTVVVDLDAP